MIIILKHLLMHMLCSCFMSCQCTSLALGDLATWASFAGAVFLGIVAIYQNKKAQEINENILNNDMSKSCYSVIGFEERQYLNLEATSYQEGYSRITAQEEGIDQDDEKYIEFIFRISDERSLPLRNISLDSISISSIKEGANKLAPYNNPICFSVLNKITGINITDKFTQFVVILGMSAERKDIFLKSDKLKVCFDLKYDNAFNVVTSAKYEFELKNTGNKLEETKWSIYTIGWIKPLIHSIEFNKRPMI